jgi:hypothetical protein
MSAHTLPRITFLPPSPERPDMHFDRAQFASRRNQPVESKYVGAHNAPETNGWKSTNGLGFDDYRRMGTERRRVPGGGRRLKTPAYMQDARRFRSVVIRFLEIRAGLVRRQPGTEVERMQKVSVLLKQKAEVISRQIDASAARFVASTDEAERKMLQRNIIEWDTQIRIYRDPSMVPAAAKAYYGEGLRSNEVGERLGLKAPHVRQMLYRLTLLDAQIQAGTDERKYGRPVSPNCRIRAEKDAIGSPEAARNENHDARPQPVVIHLQPISALQKQQRSAAAREKHLEQMRQFMRNKRAAVTYHDSLNVARAK